MKILKSIFFSVLGISAVLLFVFLANDIYQENARIQRIKGVDAKVINQLNKIMLAQESYISIKNEFCGSWDDLETFIKEENFVTVQRQEVIETVNGEDHVKVLIDTLSTMSVFDSLKSELNLISKSKISYLWRVPVSDTVFTLTADRLGNGQPICEVRDPYPLNPKRQKEGSLSALQIGSLEISTLKGNWE